MLTNRAILSSTSPTVDQSHVETESSTPIVQSGWALGSVMCWGDDYFERCFQRVGRCSVVILENNRSSTIYSVYFRGIKHSRHERWRRSWNGSFEGGCDPFNFSLDYVGWSVCAFRSLVVSFQFPMFKESFTNRHKISYLRRSLWRIQWARLFEEWPPRV